jgi:hypothetical protein
MKKITSTLFLLFCTFAVFSQGKFQFETNSHDFGSVVEGDLATHVFKFTNVGNAPIVMTNVRASCGCTTPEWSKAPVLPGKEGIIKAVYNSKGRPGNFTKSITITSNASQPVKSLKISGVVSQDPNRLAANESKKAFSLVGADKPEFSLVDKEYKFGTLQVGQKITKSFKYTNTGKADLELKNAYSKCRCTTFKSSKNTLKPGETADLEITFIPKKATEAGEKIYISTNAPYNANNFISLKGKVVDSLAPKSVIQEGGFKF